MPHGESKNCRGYGQPLIFKTMGFEQVLAFHAKHLTPHSCSKNPKLPSVFLPAIEDFGEKVIFLLCEKESIYQVPARNQMQQFDFTLQLKQTAWPWKVHDCEFLPGI
jgi:hypothetical protein